MGILPIYIFGALANALVSSINSRKQLASQRAMQKGQQEFQRQLHGETYKQQIATQLRAFALSNTWPLKTAPSDIADMLVGDERIPLYLIIAPAQQSGIQKELYSIWEELCNFFVATFSVDSRWPVVHGGYKSGYQVSRTQDIMTIFAGIRGIPTLYIAPYSTNRDNILGVTIAFWGLGTSTKPVIQNFELDVRKLYIDEIRQETEEYMRRCDENRLGESPDRSLMEENIKVFNAEGKLLEKNDFYYLDQNLNFYKSVRPSKATYNQIADKILPVIKLLSAAIVDMYFALEYNEEPRFPEIAFAIKESSPLPELLSRGISDVSGKFARMSGEQFLTGLNESYVRLIVENADLRYITEFESQFGSLGEGCRALISNESAIRQARQTARRAEVQQLADMASNGDADAQTQIAIYWFSKGELSECLKWAELAAKQGNSDAETLRDETIKVLRKHKLTRSK